MPKPLLQILVKPANNGNVLGHLVYVVYGRRKEARTRYSKKIALLYVYYFCTLNNGNVLVYLVHHLSSKLVPIFCYSARPPSSLGFWYQFQMTKRESTYEKSRVCGPAER